MRGETIWVGKPSQAAYQRTYIFCALFFWLLVPVVYAWILSHRLRNTEYEVTDFAVGTIYHHNQSQNRLLELYRIETIMVEQPERLKSKDLANLIIHSHNKNIPPIVFEAISHVETVKTTIENLVKKSNESKNIQDIQIPILQSP